MSAADASNTKPADPMDMFRGMRDSYLGAMAKTMTETVNTEGYAKANGMLLDGYLTASAPFKEAMDRSILQALEQLSLPSRLDIISLAERFTNIEMRIDDMDSKLDDLVKLSAEQVRLTGEQVKLSHELVKLGVASAEQATALRSHLDYVLKQAASERADFAAEAKADAASHHRAALAAAAKAEASHTPQPAAEHKVEAVHAPAHAVAPKTKASHAEAHPLAAKRKTSKAVRTSAVPRKAAATKGTK